MAIERKLGPFVTQQGEFYYSKKEEGKFIVVKKDQEYFKSISNTKKVSYQLKSTNEALIKIGQDNDLLVSYNKTNNARLRDDYPKRAFPTSQTLATSGDTIKRVFAQNKISGNKEIFEVASSTNATIYKFVSFNWKIGGDIDTAKQYNQRQLINAEKKMRGISEILPLDQLHKSKFNLLK